MRGVCVFHRERAARSPEALTGAVCYAKSRGRKLWMAVKHLPRGLIARLMHPLRKLLFYVPSVYFLSFHLNRLLGILDRLFSEEMIYLSLFVFTQNYHKCVTGLVVRF